MAHAPLALTVREQAARADGFTIPEMTDATGATNLASDVAQLAGTSLVGGLLEACVSKA